MIEIRACSGMEEFDACVRLETETWGYDQTELIPRKTFLLAQKIGGQVIGAFSASEQQAGSPAAAELIGFAMSLPGIKIVQGQPMPYLHSHMLAVHRDRRNRGVGAQLKREQRREALARGIRHMEWTFDPLEIKNAFLNIHRLGAVCRAYRANFYGVSSSRLQGGLPTDRLVAEWELDSPRVQAFLEGRPIVARGIEERILVPGAIEQWKASDTAKAQAVQAENRTKFEQAFAQGRVVIGFTRDAEGNGVFELGRLSN
ncbi:MAG: GNAT family N-acetyltransferase [Acidobacteriota bacterium]